METFSALGLLALCAGNSPVTGEFPPQRPVTRIFYVFFDLHLNKRLSEQSWSWLGWFETPLRSLWRHCNEKLRSWYHNVHYNNQLNNKTYHFTYCCIFWFFSPSFVSNEWMANLTEQFIEFITVTSRERHGVSNNGQLYCLFNNLFKLTQRKHKISTLPALCDRRIPHMHKGPVGLMSWISIWHVYILMRSSNGNIFRVTGPLCGEFTGPGDFPAQRPVTRHSLAPVRFERNFR